VGGFGASIGAGQPQPFFDFAGECVFEGFGMRALTFAYEFAVFHARSARNTTGEREVGPPARRCIRATPMSCGARPHGAHARIERRAAEILEPRHAHAFETAVERPSKTFSRFVDGERRAGIRSRDGAEHEGEIGHGTSKASGRTERGPAECSFRVRHAADGRTETNYVAECGGIAQRAAGIGAADDGCEAAGQRDCRAAGRSAACFRQVVGIARRAKTALNVYQANQFRRVGLADGSPARRIRSTTRSSSVGMLSVERDRRS
jgi:hypothetical protein